MDVTRRNIGKKADVEWFVAYLCKKATTVESLAKRHGAPLSLRVDGTTAAEVLYRVTRDAKRMVDPDLVKRNALLTFWVRKLKPNSIYAGQKSGADFNWQRYVNELVAILSGTDSLNFHRPVRLSPRFFADLLYDFRFRAWSPYAVTQLYSAIWGCLEDDGTTIPHVEYI